MTRLASILVSCSGDPGIAIRRARRLSTLTGASLSLCDVVEKAPEPTASAPSATASAAKLLAKQAAARLDTLASSIRGSDVTVNTAVLTGKAPAVELTREAIRAKHDMVIKTADAVPGRLSPKRYLEQTDLHLVRQCPVPVFLARKRVTGRHACVVAAVAPPPEGEQTTNIPNHEIIEAAIEIARVQHQELHVIRAWRAYGEAALRKSRPSRDRLREYLRETRERFRAALDTLLKPYSDHINSKRVHLLKGAPATVIPRFTEQRPVDVLVMGAGPRAGVAEILVGDTTRSLVDDTGCSLVTVKPTGFQSPVEVGV